MKTDLVQKLARIDDYDLIETIDLGIAEGQITKADMSELIARRADETRQPGESVAQSYARYITKDIVGSQLRARERTMAGFDSFQKSVLGQSMIGRSSKPPLSAQNDFDEMVLNLQKQRPELTKSKAMDCVMGTPAGKKAFSTAMGR